MKEVSEEAGFSLLRFLNATPGLTLQNLSYVEQFLINGTLPSLVKGGAQFVHAFVNIVLLWRISVMSDSLAPTDRWS